MRWGVLGLAMIVHSHVAAAETVSWQRHTIDNSSRGADGVRLADVNGDQLPDIVTGWEEGGEVRLYLHPGHQQVRTAWPAVIVGKVPSPEDAVLVDLDQDGMLDVMSSTEGKSRTIFFHFAPSDPKQLLDSNAWTTSPLPCTVQKQMWMYALPRNVDGRYGPDLVVGSKGTDGAIGWLQAPSSPRTLENWRYHSLRSSGWIMTLANVDMDQDGDDDVLFSDRKGTTRGVGWLEFPGADQVQTRWVEHGIGAADREVMFLSASDSPSDLFAHGLFAAVSGRGISKLVPQRERASRGLLWTHQEIPWPYGFGPGKGVAAADINLDGKLDIVFSCENAKGDLAGVGWLEGSTTGHYTRHVISGAAGVKFDRLELIDLDKDGDLDVITCEERDNLGVIWYENPIRSNQ